MLYFYIYISINTKNILQAGEDLIYFLNCVSRST